MTCSRETAVTHRFSKAPPAGLSVRAEECSLRQLVDRVCVEGWGAAEKGGWVEKIFNRCGRPTGRLLKHSQGKATNTLPLGIYLLTPQTLALWEHRIPHSPPWIQKHFDSFFKKDFLNLFLERGKGERKRGRETLMWERNVNFSNASRSGTEPAT